jgi:uncharacterized protein (TIGR00297 family)
MQNQGSLMIRKSVHVATGFLILSLSFTASRELLLILFIAGAAFSFITFNYSKFYALHKTSYSSLGTLFYPVGIISSFLVLYDQPLFYFRSVVMILTISDIAAYIAGQIKKYNVSFRILHDCKSLFGVLAFSISALLILHFYLPPMEPGNIYRVFLLMVLAVNLEVISIKGSDNMTIPLGLALFFLISQKYDLNPPWLLTVIMSLSAGTYLLYKWHVLTRYGSLSAYLLGVYFLGILGTAWIIPVLFFFISSVLFSKLHSSLLGKSKLSYTRNAWQVMANIIWAFMVSLIFLFSGNEIFILLFIVLMSSVTADTWASELGPVMNKKSLCVADMKMYPAGITGGISAGGTLAALVASVLISTGSFYLFFGEFNVMIIALLALSGFFACFTDTFLGAFAEKKFMGWDFFRRPGSGLSPNDLVNILGSATGPLFFLLFYYMCRL